MASTSGPMGSLWSATTPQWWPSTRMTQTLSGNYSSYARCRLKFKIYNFKGLNVHHRYGEVVPLGANYLASYPNGVRTGIKELAPHLLGQDPTKIGVINLLMDYNMKGHPYVKSPIDMACWDILGKVVCSSFW